MKKKLLILGLLNLTLIPGFFKKTLTPDFFRKIRNFFKPPKINSFNPAYEVIDKIPPNFPKSPKSLSMQYSSPVGMAYLARIQKRNKIIEELKIKEDQIINLEKDLENPDYAQWDNELQDRINDSKSELDKIKVKLKKQERILEELNPVFEAEKFNNIDPKIIENQIEEIDKAEIKEVNRINLDLLLKKSAARLKRLEKANEGTVFYSPNIEKKAETNSVNLDLLLKKSAARLKKLENNIYI